MEWRLQKVTSVGGCFCLLASIPMRLRNSDQVDTKALTEGSVKGPSWTPNRGPSATHSTSRPLHSCQSKRGTHSLVLVCMRLTTVSSCCRLRVTKRSALEKIHPCANRQKTASHVPGFRTPFLNFSRSCAPRKTAFLVNDKQREVLPFGWSTHETASCEASKQPALRPHLLDLVNVSAHVVVRNDVLQVHKQLVALCQRLSQRITTMIAPLIPGASCGRAGKMLTFAHGAQLTLLHLCLGVGQACFARRTPTIQELVHLLSDPREQLLLVLPLFRLCRRNGLVSAPRRSQQAVRRT